ncbi:putative 2-alpha-hydroxytaxane 2-O-benzoyltransferase [Medicago truncatula]|uniref:HXXXD-type acyl-transferase family protein n=1 Tax=Medicago truncatula TaxID=3880 RepID=G7LHN0_MEDTR|nr:HXXXD-type acyl-transferase family protein [Medicago truncatula]RHN40356.1 putative 2-alpha-hydroxytaxane 2-O-benzoyltransferase [Medicago truncatula]
MSDFRVLSTSTIKAPNAGDSTDRIIHLTPWDLQFLPFGSNQKGFLYHHPTVVNMSNKIQHFKQSLSCALAFFPPFTGRLEITEHEDNTISCSLACKNAGALFVHAKAENTCVADILGSTYLPSFFHSFFPLNGVINYEGTSHPLLAFQVTELSDGTFVSWTMNHVVLDGMSNSHFINSLAEISRGSCHQISVPPTLERLFPNGIQRPIRFPFVKLLIVA